MLYAIDGGHVYAGDHSSLVHHLCVLFRRNHNVNSQFCLADDTLYDR